MDMRTSSSLHARPPPVEVAFLFFVTPYSWRSMASDVGVYGRGWDVICKAGDMVTQFPGVSYSQLLNCHEGAVQSSCPARRYVPRIESRTKNKIVGITKENKQN